MGDDPYDYPDHPNTADRIVAIVADIEPSEVDQTGGDYEQVVGLLAEEDHRHMRACASAMGLEGDWDTDDIEEALSDAFEEYRAWKAMTPQPTDVRPDRMAVWDDPGRWIVMQEADGTKWVHVHVFHPRGGLYGHSYTFSAELAAVIGAAAVRPIAPDSDHDCPF